MADAGRMIGTLSAEDHAAERALVWSVVGSTTAPRNGR
jgi:hypothetical protein